MEIIKLATNQLNQNGYTKNTLTRDKIGAIFTFPIDFTPEDCLSCDGYLLEVIDFAELYKVIGNKFNQENDLAGTFRIPDYNITKRYLQPSQDVGVLVEPSLPQHTHSGTTSNNGAHTHTAQSAGGHKHDIGFDNYAGSRYGTVSKSGSYKQAGWGQAASNTNCAYTSTDGAHTHKTDSQGAHTHTLTTGNASSAVYNSKNIVLPASQTVHLCIKYK